MKKTFITALCTLAAASGVLADTTELTLDEAVLNVQQYDGTATYTGTYTSMEAFGSTTRPTSTIMLVLDWSALQTEITSTDAYAGLTRLSTSSRPQDDGYALGFAIKSNGDDTFTLATTYKKFTSVRNYTTTVSSANTLNGKIVLTLSVGDGTEFLGTNGTTTSELGEDTGLKSTYSTYNYLQVNTELADVIDSIYVFDQDLSQTQIESLAQTAISRAIPEPATATLSLLALAGLAARRRRK